MFKDLITRKLIRMSDIVDRLKNDPEFTNKVAESMSQILIC